MGYVPLHNVVLVWLHEIRLPGQKDTPALTVVLWLDNKGFVSFICELSFEVGHLKRKEPCGWKEVVFRGELLLHLVEVLSEEVLSGQDLHAWKL